MREPFARPPRAAHAEPPAHAPNAAMLIDFDNVTMGIRSDLQNQLRRLMNSEIIKGKVAVQRAYADWRRYPQYIVPLSEASIDLIFAPAFGSNKKNATDIRLAIDALELVFTRPEIGTFILLSGDSDFSSLVVKLKEYGKYVIGVGIRESSSDLLVQNCDEYYGYNELTGLTKQSDVERVSRDPWELVVQAVSQMRTDRDVMRSDRLKQVMQEIDPTFNEKDVGFSRFSKFVSEASQRGLLRLNKLDNGQYEVDLGQNANVSPAVEAAMDHQGEPAAAPAHGPADRARREQRARRGASRAAPGGITLAAAFDALRNALLELGAVGAEATDADQVRDRMIERTGASQDPIFERTRFQRLLRQAHDANVIELAKSGDAYLLKLGTSQAGSDETTAAPETRGPAGEERAGRAPARRRRGERGGSRRGGRERGERPVASVEPDPGESATEAAQPVGPAPAPGDARRNPRFRRGSRGPEVRQPAAAGEGAASPPPAAAGEGAASSPAAPVDSPPTGGSGAGFMASRSVRHRLGSRGPRRDGAGTPTTPLPPGAGAAEQPPAPVAAPARLPARERQVQVDPPAVAAPEAASGFLRRVTAALQKAVKGPGSEPKSHE
ncbi:MAG TPA: NYN domain-containing protein [Gemmatimonadales bacterium]|nr:NYN domain-containing protein [Gemmatimonadales bacterium]